jgi:hypothetical protein
LLGTNNLHIPLFLEDLGLLPLRGDLARSSPTQIFNDFGYNACL